MDQARKEYLAKQSAKLFMTQLHIAGVPADVQLMSADMLVRAIFTTAFRESNRLQVFDDWQAAIRIELQAGMKGRNRRGKKTRNR